MELVVKIPDDKYADIIRRGRVICLSGYEEMIANGTPLPKGHGRKFEKIVVEHPSEDLCTYPEYKGKPYYSIQYEENGESIIGYGTYKPEVLSQYLRDYFIAPTIIVADKGEE